MVGLGYSGFAKAKNVYKALAENAKHEYFLFLENDWYLIENKSITRNRLISAVSLLSENIADVVRFRHRIFPRLPCGIVYKNIKHPEKTQKCDLAFLPSTTDNPCSLSKEINEQDTDGEKYYFVGPKNTYWTNNPCLLKTRLAKKIANIEFPLPINPNRKTKYNTMYSNVCFEGDMMEYWQKSSFITALSPGLIYTS